MASEATKVNIIIKEWSYVSLDLHRRMCVSFLSSSNSFDGFDSYVLNPVQTHLMLW